MQLTAYITLLRPRQWLKNLMIFFPPFLSGAFPPAVMLTKGVLPFAAFCCVSSAAYLFNDLMDCERDRVHPEKKRRPLPSGQVSPASVVVLIGVFLAAGAFLSLQLPGMFSLYVGLYLVFSVLYSLFLKELPIIDVFCISLGFVLRLYGGGEAFNVLVSDWLFLSVFLLAIFLGFGKRYSERRILGGHAGRHRKNLEDYPEGFLESALYLSGAAVLITYAMYAISKPAMVYTVPLCVFGLMRYLMRIKSGRGGDPTSALLNDLTLLVTGILWVVLVGWCVYQ